MFPSSKRKRHIKEFYCSAAHMRPRPAHKPRAMTLRADLAVRAAADLAVHNKTPLFPQFVSEAFLKMMPPDVGFVFQLSIALQNCWLSQPHCPRLHDLKKTLATLGTRLFLLYVGSAGASRSSSCKHVRDCHRTYVPYSLITSYKPGSNPH